MLVRIFFVLNRYLDAVLLRFYCGKLAAQPIKYPVSATIPQHCRNKTAVWYEAGRKDIEIKHGGYIQKYLAFSGWIFSH
jgi:hypothetical protein